ncbi:hypothetical protein I4U23_010823 [Adineta vaga]|nr:hypothetical protein I4U23_010823 [Adineta vaga]
MFSWIRSLLLLIITLNFVTQQNIPCFDTNLCAHNGGDCIRVEEEKKNEVELKEYCQCYQGYMGPDCSQCMIGYYRTSYSSCRSCNYCRNNGTCKDQKCICVDPFVGEDCEMCKEHLYGKDCLPLPVIFNVTPTIFDDTQMGRINITIIGENFLTSNGTIGCLFRHQHFTLIETSIGFLLNNTHILCPLPVLNSSALQTLDYQITVHIDNQEISTDFYYENNLHINRTCPQDVTNCHNGVCELGECKCLPNFQGPNCTECLANHFYPFCLRCDTLCQNNGTCKNQMCICSDPDRFTGHDCSSCKPPYYRPGCEMRPVLLAVEPSVLFDTDYRSIILIGDNFNISGQLQLYLQQNMVQCQIKLRRKARSDDSTFYQGELSSTKPSKLEKTVEFHGNSSKALVGLHNLSWDSAVLRGTDPPPLENFIISLEGNNTHIIFRRPRKLDFERSYNVHLYFNGTEIGKEDLHSALILQTKYKCPNNATNCGNNGRCELGKCVCDRGFNGSLCQQCADNYYLYPNCYSCHDCENRGQCLNETCICYDPSRFIGATCSDCMPHYYGLSCLQYPIMLTAEPTFWNDINGETILIHGDHFDLYNQTSNSIKNKSLICSFMKRSFDENIQYIVHAHYANNTEIVCQVSTMLPGFYSLTVSLDNGNTWIDMQDRLTFDIRNTCPSYTQTCSYHGICELSLCKCQQNFAGKICNRCADGYFGYPHCLSCNPYCLNKGVCINHTCICNESDRFTGFNCDTCQLHYYGPSCLQYPIALSIEPPQWRDIENINVTIVGDHFNISGLLTNSPTDRTVQCKFYYFGDNDYIVSAIAYNNTHIVCPVKNMLYDAYAVYFSLDNSTTWNSGGSVLTVSINQTCPSSPERCSSFGYCSLGKCVCNTGYTGRICDQCASDFFNYPNCISCSRCENGMCKNESCICSDTDRFTGYDCSKCIPPYYGSSCLQDPIVLNLVSSNQKDTDQVNITILGDNFNVSNLLSNLINDQAIICRFRSNRAVYSFLAHTANNTHIICQTSEMLSALYRLSVSLTDGNTWLEEETSLFLTVIGACPLASPTCSYHGFCQLGFCQCETNFGGSACNRCADDYFSYPNCFPCRHCKNNGTCINSSCICSEPDRFTSYDCGTCQPHYYGSSCLQYPVVLSIKPQQWQDIEHRNISIIGDHFNMSGLVLLESVQCNLRSRQGDDYIVNAVSVKTTHIMCPVNRMKSEYYDVFISLDNGTQWFSGADQNTMQIYINPTCPPSPSICSDHGTCSFRNCSCHSNYAGMYCNRCAEGYFHYPNCYRCSACKNNGTCHNQICVCADSDRFTGYDCGTCQPHYYGKLCQQHPVTLSVNPSRWDDIGNINVTIIGDHFNRSNSLMNVTVQCRFSYYDEKYVYMAINANNTHIICPVKNMSSRYYSVHISVDNGLTWYSGDERTLTIQIIRTCPIESSTCSSNGVCNMGSCLCNPTFSGKLCDQCAVGYYSYPYCYSCRSCESTGSCKNGSCICYEPNRFTGISCKNCQPSFYGGNCLQYPIIQRINSTLWKDIDAVNVTIIGDNFNISNILSNLIRNKFIICKFHGQNTYIYHAHTISNTQIICQVSTMIPGSYKVSVSFTNGTSWLVEERSLYIEVEGTCSNQLAACLNGKCIFGKCVCSQEYIGDQCDQCAENYFYLYGICQSCTYCKNNGLCMNGTCICSDRFIGDDCSICASHYYGSSCEQYPILLSVQPTRWNGIEQRNITLIGDHFNISENISLDFVQCNFRYDQHIDYIIQAVSINNTHIICFVQDLQYKSYEIYFSLDNGINWQTGDQGKSIQVIIDQTCPIDSPTCSNHGECSLQSCRCYSKYTGQFCDQCSNEYFAYPNCYSCLNSCKNNGTCMNGTCICPNNFIGIDCSKCASHYYGSLCKQRPVLLSIQPRIWNGVEYKNVTLIGDHFNISGNISLDSVRCNFRNSKNIDHITSAVAMNNTHIICSVRDLLYQSYQVYFSLDNDTNWQSGTDGNSIQVTIEQTCPVNMSACSGYGQCSLGNCLCNEGYAGQYCEHCADEYFNYPNCYSCLDSCGNSGTCINGSCICSIGFTGIYCTTCAPHYYGPTCKQYLIAFRIEQSIWDDVGNVNLSIIGDHFNISGELDQLLANGSIQYSIDSVRNLSTVLYANNTHIIFPAPKIYPNIYYASFILQPNSVKTSLGTVRIQATCPLNGCKYGSCLYGTCRCNSYFEGDACDRCIDGFFLHSGSCYSCQSFCLNGGQCFNQTCVCSDPNRFTGFNCEGCLPPYYKPNCLQIPTVLSIQPWTLVDYGGIDITISGDNFDISGQLDMLLTNKSVLCLLRSTYYSRGNYTYIAKRATNKEIVCRTSVMLSDNYYYSVSLNNGLTWTAYGSESIYVNKVCPVTLNECNGNGRCEQGKCICITPWTGSTCQIYNIKPVINSVSNYTLAENESIVIDLSTNVIVATEPIIYELIKATNDESMNFFRNNIQLDRSTGLMHIINAYASLNSYNFNIGISNSGGKESHTLIINVPLSYTVNVRWDIDTTNRYRLSKDRQISLSGNLTYLYRSKYLLSPTIFVVEIGDYYYNHKFLCDQNGFFNHSFLVNNNMNQINLAAVHPAYAWQIPSIILQETIYLASLYAYGGTWYGASLPIYSNYVNNFTNLIAIRNSNKISLYNISLVVEIPAELSSCIKYVSFYPDSILSSLLSYQQQLYSLSILTNCSFQNSITYKLLESRFQTMSVQQLPIFSNWSCRTRNYCTSHGQCIAHETCQCNSQYSGDNCDQCASDYHNYPSCVKCPLCIHGTAICTATQATCQCPENNHFFGPLCQFCQTGFYGPNCEAIPMVSSLNPTSGLDISNTSVIIYGDNFNNHSFFQCLLYNSSQEIILPGVYVTNQQINCVLPSHSPGQVIIEIKINGTKLSQKLYYQYLPSCPREGCIHGTCAFGSCLCRYPYFGSNCTLTPIVPKLKPMQNFTLTEKFPFSLNLTNYLIEGDTPLSWWLDQSFPGLSLISNETHTLLFCPSIPAFSQSYLITINVKNKAMPTIARQSFYLHIPIAYNVSIKFSSEYSQTTIIQSIRLRIQGQINALDSNYQLTEWDSTISVWIDVNGKNRRYLPLVTAPKWRLPPGSFETHYTPLSNEYGLITIGASHPILKQINDGKDQDKLVYFGMKIHLVRNFVLEFRTGSRNNFTAIAKLINPTPLNITNLNISLIGPIILQNYSLILNCNQSTADTIILGNDECLIDLSLQFNKPYIGQVGFQFSNNQITSSYLIISVNVKADRAEYSLSSSHRSFTIARNSQQLFSTTIFNIGSQPSNKLLVRVPNDQSYLTAITPILSSINVSSNATITYLITISDSAPLSIIDIRSEIIDEENQVSVGMTFRLTIVGNNITSTNLSFLIEDEFTYFSPDAPRVVNATIILISRNLGHRYTLLTNDDGRTSVALTPDTYQVTAQANKHSSYSSMITVDLSSNGQETVIFLQRQVISHTWSVTPKPFENEYTIILEATFETNVPLPVITMNPMSLDLDYLENSNVEQMELTITNHGLIRAEDLELNLPTNHPFLKFILLNDVIGHIEANSSIILSFRIQRSIIVRSQIKSPSICLGGILIYKYECNGKKRTVMTLPAFHRSTLGDIPNSNCIVNAPTLPPYIPTITGGGIVENYQNGPVDIQTNIVPVTTATKSCRSIFDCARAMIECGLGFIPSPLNCVTSLVTFVSGTSLDIALDDVSLLNLGLSGFGLFLSCTANPVSMVLTGLFSLAMCIKGFDDADCFSRRSLNIDPIVLTAYHDHQRMVNAVDNYIQIYVLIYGNENWLKVDDAQWWTAFDRARSSSSEMGLFLSQREFQDLLIVLPNGINQSMTNDFLLYYNRTMTVWKYNTTETLPYLKQIDWLASLKQYQEDTKYANTKGYDDIMAAFSNTHQKLKKAKEESEKRRGICATVKIRIIQKITFTREGFDAKLEMDNTGNSPVENIQLNITIKDNDNQHDRLHYFSIGQPTFTGSITGITGDGKLPSKSSGSVNWFIIPYSTAAPTEPTWYRVGGNLSYNLDGEFLHIPLTPDTILVQPDAQLHIAYFLDRYVIGPDPLIISLGEEQIKPEPFILSMLITNSGYGSANDFRITSGQPTIVENEKGLLINFEIISMNVNNTLSSSPSLTRNLGNLQPFTTTSITWQMLASLKGLFHSFNATYTEKNPNGDPKLSLLMSLTSHSLIRQVSLDIYDRQLNDGKCDYLVDDFPDGEFIPDTVFTSTNATISYPVYYVLNVTADYQSIDSNTMKIIVIVTPILSIPSLSFIYIRIKNIYPNYKIISSSIRVNDGLNITMNTWFNYDINHFLGENNQRKDLHIFDRLPNEYLRQKQQIYQITVKIQQNETNIIPIDMTTISSSTPFPTTEMTEKTSMKSTDPSHTSSSMITISTTEITNQYSPTIVYNTDEYITSVINFFNSSNFILTANALYIDFERQLSDNTSALKQGILTNQLTPSSVLDKQTMFFCSATNTYQAKCDTKIPEEVKDQDTSMYRSFLIASLVISIVTFLSLLTVIIIYFIRKSHQHQTPVQKKSRRKSRRSKRSESIELSDVTNENIASS